MQETHTRWVGARINQNGNRSDSPRSQRLWMNHQNQCKHRGRRNQEGEGRGRSRGRERDDPVAEKGSNRWDLKAGGCWGAPVCMSAIATPQLTRVPLTAPASCWTPFFSLSLSLCQGLCFSLAFFYWVVFHRTLQNSVLIWGWLGGSLIWTLLLTCHLEALLTL